MKKIFILLLIIIAFNCEAEVNKIGIITDIISVENADFTSYPKYLIELDGKKYILNKQVHGEIAIGKFVYLSNSGGYICYIIKDY